AALLTLVPWQELLARATPLRLGLVSFVSTLMPVPIALDVMFAAQLQQQGIAAGYVMLFAITLGTFSIIPSIYLWREVSKPLSVFLFLFFLMLGWVLGLLFLLPPKRPRWFMALVTKHLRQPRFERSAGPATSPGGLVFSSTAREGAWQWGQGDVNELRQ